MDTRQTAELFATNPAFAKQAEDAIRSMLSRSATDRGFRTKLIADPRPRSPSSSAAQPRSCTPRGT